MRHPAKLSNILGKLNKNSQWWYLLGRTSSEVFVMLVVALHSLLFLWCCLLFVFTFLDYFFMPPALHIGFSGTGKSPPALSSNPGYFQLPYFFVTFLSRALLLWVGIFYHMCFFSYAPSPHFCHNLLLSRPPWEPAILLWSLQDFMLILKTQTWPISLFDSQQYVIFIFRRIRI